MALSTGTRLGSYEITGPLGAGGMGEVYRARDVKLGRDVAIKTLPSALASDADRLARFEREAKLLAALNHAHIASVYGLDDHDGTQYLAMELIEGETLEAKLEHGALPLEEALHLALQIAAALEAAHEKGVVHRDLKPANVMVTRDGQVKVLDFGLAKAFAGDPSQAIAAHSPALSAAMTQQGLILGTAGYMSPEQASGQATDQRADIWAFGVLLYEMLTGMPVFSGESVPHILAAVLQTEPDWQRLPKYLHPRLRLLLERCLEKKVRNRYHSMADVRVDIEKVLADPQGGRVTPSAAPPLWRRALVPTATLAIGALLAGVYLIAVRLPSAPPGAAPEARISRFVITPPATAPLAALGTGNIAISPDGKRIAYVAQKPDNTNEIYVRELDALEGRPLSGTGTPGGSVMPFFSADGKSVGFNNADRGVLSAAIDGRPATKVLDAPKPGFLGGAWAEDGSLVFSSYSQLQRIAKGGAGKPEPLTPERPGRFVAAPVLLPGGRAVLYASVDSSGAHVAALDLNTGEEKTLIEGSTAVYAETGHIVFARGTTLMAVPFSVAELAVTGEPVALVQGVRHPSDRNAADFAISANGTLVYVPTTSEPGTGSAAVWVERSGAVVGPPVTGPLVLPRDPHISPDGKRLLLTTGPIGEGHVWSYDFGGRPPIPLALTGDNRLGVWSPDGLRVAFMRLDGTSARVFTTPADGSLLTPEPLGSVTGGPLSWSAAGDVLVVVIRDGQADLLAAPTAGTGEARKIAASEYNETDGALSRDGRWVAYVSYRTGAPEIWVQRYPDGVAVRVSTNGGFEPHWSADGRELFYVQGTTMMAVAVETAADFSFGPPTALFSGPFSFSQSPAAGSYDVAPDGRFLLIAPAGASAGDSPPNSIVVVENWTEELKRLVPTK
jgi:Tol biopolymer transport system component